jgi:hypothetical protein
VHDAVVVVETTIREAEERLVAQLKEWLVGVGFTVLKDFRDEKYFANSLVELERRSLSIRVVWDRSEWEILLAGPDRVWVPLMTWRRIVDRPDYYPDPVRLTGMIALLADRLEAIQVLADGGDFATTADTLAKLDPGRGREHRGER